MIITPITHRENPAFNNSDWCGDDDNNNNNAFIALIKIHIKSYNGVNCDF